MNKTLIRKHDLERFIKSAIGQLSIKEPLWHPDCFKTAPYPIARLLFLAGSHLQYKVYEGRRTELFYAHPALHSNTVNGNYIDAAILGPDYANKPLLWAVLGIFGIRVTGAADEVKNYQSTSVSLQNTQFLNQIMLYFQFFCDNFEIEK